MNRAELLTPEVARFVLLEEKLLPEEKLSLPKREDIHPELLRIVEEIRGISSTWNPVEFMTVSMDTYEAGKIKVFEAFDNGGVHNPIFRYPNAEGLDLSEDRKKLLELKKRIRQFKPTDQLSRLTRIALFGKINDDKATCDLVAGLNEDDVLKAEELIKDAVDRKYGKVDSDILDKARINLDERISGKRNDKSPDAVLAPEQQAWMEDKSFTFSPQEQVEIYKWALAQYGILKTDDNPNGYEVLLDPEAKSLDVRDKSQKGKHIAVPEKRQGDPMTKRKLLEIIAHEIEGHAVQSMNGEALFMLGGGLLKIDNELHYEAEGKRREAELSRRLFGDTVATALPFYALAIETAQAGGSFFDVFKDQVTYRLRVATKTPRGQLLPTDIDAEKIKKAKEDAFLTTSRVMRIHRDQTNPLRFALTKDIAYLAGEIEDQEMLKLGYGYIPEAAIAPKGGFQLLARFKYKETDLPYRFQDVATRYWNEILKPKFEAEKAA